MALSEILPAASVVVRKTNLAWRQSPPGRKKPMTGIRTSAASAETTLPTAAPMITPIASASAFVLVRNPRNSAIMRLMITDALQCIASREERHVRNRNDRTRRSSAPWLARHRVDRRDHGAD